MEKYVVGIHGVGDSSPGMLIAPLTKPLSESACDFTYEHTARLIDGVEYPVGESDREDEDDVYEVNWADVGRPSSNIFSVVPHLFRLLWASLWIADCWHEDKPQLLWPVRFYRWVVEFAFLSTLLYAIVMRLVYLSDLPQMQLVIGIGAGVGCAVIGWFFSAPTDAIRRGLGVVAPIAIVASTIAISLGWSGLAFVYWSTFAYGVTTLAVLGLLVLACVVIFIFHRGGLWQRLTRMAAAYLPIMALAVLATSLWMANPEVLGKDAKAKDANGATEAENPKAAIDNDFARREKLRQLRVTETQALYASRFHVTTVTVAFALAFSVLGAITLVAIAFYFGVRITAKYHSLNAGSCARFFLYLANVLLPVLLTLVIAMAAIEAISPLEYDDGETWPTRFDQVDFLKPARDLVASNNLGFQLTQILLFLLVPVGVVVSDIVGDVLFFVVPPYNMGSADYSNTREKYFYDEGTMQANRNYDDGNSQRIVAGSRFAAAVNALLSKHTKNQVLVVAHSQGSVIALREIQRMPESIRCRINLLTIGSPIHTLYKPFFGIFDPLDKDQMPNCWINLYRRGDYVGGSIDLDAVRLSISAGKNHSKVLLTKGGVPLFEDREMSVAVEKQHGHTHYWTEPKMHETMSELRGEAAKPAASYERSGDEMSGDDVDQMISDIIKNQDAE